MISLGPSFALHFGDGHFAGFREQLRQMAFVGRIEVLNQHEYQAGIVGQVAQEIGERVQPPRGGSYADNAERHIFRVFIGGGPRDSRRGRRHHGRVGSFHREYGSSVWVGQVLRTRRVSRTGGPANAGFLSGHASPFPFSQGRKVVIAGMGTRTC